MAECDNKYHINNKSYPLLVGSRAQVWHNTAYKTSGNLTRRDLIKNKSGRIVSIKKHKTAKCQDRLRRSGYGTEKGKFGYVKVEPKTPKKCSKTGKSLSDTVHKRKPKAVKRSVSDTTHRRNIPCKGRKLSICNRATKKCKMAKGPQRTFCRKRKNTKHKA
uniref:Uncharacterized protein n=1 Tax=viral metagenome TaxID=1070528 RepID=A0A6C0I580_9ZZZZ